MFVVKKSFIFSIKNLFITEEILILLKKLEMKKIDYKQDKENHNKKKLHIFNSSLISSELMPRELLWSNHVSR